MVFLNLVVQSICIDGIKDFMKAWMSLSCKDFRIVFIDKDLTEQLHIAVNYAKSFAKALSHEEMVAIVDSIDGIPQALVTRDLEGTSVLPKSIDEVALMKTTTKPLSTVSAPIELKSLPQHEKAFFKIIVPNYNNMAYIKKCLDSILNLTFQDFKIIVVDDLSTDGSDKLCAAYAKANPNKIVYKQLASKGYAGAARNVGLDYPIDCKYILFIDSDDWLHDNRVLKNIHDTILKSKKDVKLIKMAMLHFYGKGSRKNFIKDFSGSRLTLEYAFYKGCGPGRTCISSELAKCKFKENRRVANDVIWFLRCIDNIKEDNLLSITFPCLTYNCVSLTSGTNLIKKNRKSQEFILSMRLLLSDLKKEVFKTSIVKNILKNLINLYSLKFPDPTPMHKAKNMAQLSNLARFNNAIKYELLTSAKASNKIHVLLVNFGNTMSYTRRTINDLLVQTEDFDLTIVDNNSDTPIADLKYFKLLHSNWNFLNRHLHIIGLKSEVALNHIWNSFVEMTSNPWLCFLNNDVCIPDNFISDNVKVINLEKNVGIINHASNNSKYKTSSKLDYKIYDKSSSKFLHRQGWDFTISRSTYVKIPEEFTTFVGDSMQFNNAYLMSKDVAFLYSSPIIHYCSTSRKKNAEHFCNLLNKERQLFLSDDKYKKYGNANTYDIDKSLSLMRPENIDLLTRNVYGNKNNIIVSMTTCNKRILNIPKVLQSILDLTRKPSKIIVNISLEEFINERIIPDDVLHFILTNNIELNWVKTDTKVYKKIIPTLLKYKNDLVLSIDDDFIYPKTMIEDFYRVYRAHPNSPISGNKITKFGMACHCGCASLVQYKFYNIYIEDYMKYYEHCPSSDLFFTMAASRNGYAYARTKDTYFNNMKAIKTGYNYSKGNSISIINSTYDWLSKNI